MKLVIAEKPSVAQSIAKVLGATSREDGCLVGNGYIISWCFGHLVELASADAYDPHYAKWVLNDLPIIPENWKYVVSADKGKQFEILSGLMSDKRVDGLVCATEAICTACAGKAAVVQSITRQEKTAQPPKLYDLTTLQRDANRILGYTAQQTLDYIQSLYEKKLVTYPRTDSKYLTDDMQDAIPELVKTVCTSFPFVENPPVHAERVIDSSKVSDHHVIILTRTLAGTDLSGLPTGETSILSLIAARLLCAVGEPCVTAEWEAKLQQVEHGELSASGFMGGIIKLTNGLIKNASTLKPGQNLFHSDREAIGICPRCGKPVYEGKKSLYCSGYKDTLPCGFSLRKNDRFFSAKKKALTRKIAAALLKDGQVSITGLYSQKTRNSYDATVLLADTGGKYVNFMLEFSGKGQERTFRK